MRSVAHEIVVPSLVANRADGVPGWADIANVPKLSATTALAIVQLFRLQPFAHACGMPRLVAVLARNFVRKEDAVRLKMVVSAAPLADVAVTALSLSLATALSPIALALPTIAKAFAFAFSLCFASACVAASSAHRCNHLLRRLLHHLLELPLLHRMRVGGVVRDQSPLCRLNKMGRNGNTDLLSSDDASRPLPVTSGVPVPGGFVESRNACNHEERRPRDQL